MKTKYVSIMLCCLLCLALLPINALADTNDRPLFSITVDQVGVGLDQDIQVTVTGAHLNDTYGYELRLTYDNERLQFKKADSHWDGISVPAIEKDGEIVFAHSLIGKAPSVNGKQNIASFIFKTKAEGDAEVKLTRVELVDSKVDSIVYQPDLAVEIPVASTLTFYDMEGHWAREQVEKLEKLGIVKGYPDGSFRPNEFINRAEFVTMLVRAIPLQVRAESTITNFTDYDKIPAWARPPIAEAVSAEVVVGYPDRSFRAANKITRTEMAVIAIKSTGLALNSENLPPYSDIALIPAWAHSYIATATEIGLITGRGNNIFAPNALTTRAEAATIISRLLELE